MKKFFIAMTLLTATQSCVTDSAGVYETRVLNEVFDDLVEKMGASNAFEIPPSPIPFIDNDESLGYDTARYNRESDEIERWNGKMRDTTLVMAVFDTLFTCYNLNLDLKSISGQLTNRSYFEALHSMGDSSMVNHPLNLFQIENSKRFILKYASGFPQGRDIWKKEYDFLFSGVLRVSRICFDKEHRLGLFYCSYACGRLCGEEAIICIRKVDGKWRIENKISLGIS
jgi:hypothetical protein